MPTDQANNGHSDTHPGHTFYVEQVRPGLRPEDDGRFVAVDAASGDYEVDEDDYAAVTRLQARRPAADIWLERAGFPTAYQFGRGG